LTSDSAAAQAVLEHITFSFDGGPTLNFAEGEAHSHAASAASEGKSFTCVALVPS
jgi:hypothetical protein